MLPTHTGEIIATAGDTLYAQWVARSSSGSLVDLTGVTLTGEIRDALSGGTLLHALTLVPGGIDGVITATLSPANCSALAGTYAELPADGTYKDAGYFDIQAAKDGDIRTLVAGLVRLRAEVTTP